MMLDRLIRRWRNWKRRRDLRRHGHMPVVVISNVRELWK